MNRLSSRRPTSGLLLVVGLTLAATGASASAQDIFAGPFVNPANGHSYVLLTPSTALQAKAAAEALGGYLVTINDADENEWVRANLAGFGGLTRRIWLGLTDTEVEGTYVWMNGEPATYFNWQTNPLQPDNNFGRDAINGEDYVEMISNVGATAGQWNDQPEWPTVNFIYGAVEFNTGIGGCCQPSACSILTALACGGLGGSYAGDGTNCASSPASPVLAGPFSSGQPIGPDAGTITTDTQTVSGGPASVAIMDVAVSLTHSYIGDLRIELVNDQTGTVVILVDRLCAGNDNLSLTFRDGAGTITCASPTVGTVAPNQPLAGFAGVAANGAWSLRITDNANIDGGTLESWSISFYESLSNVCTAPACGTADFNQDGDVGTDADIEAFFACLAGNCCDTCFTADFNNDGDVGTDADIEAFFRVLAGGNC